MQWVVAWERESSRVPDQWYSLRVHAVAGGMRGHRARDPVSKVHRLPAYAGATCGGTKQWHPDPRETAGIMVTALSLRAKQASLPGSPRTGA